MITSVQGSFAWCNFRTAQVYPRTLNPETLNWGGGGFRVLLNPHPVFGFEVQAVELILWSLVHAGLALILRAILFGI